MPNNLQAINWASDGIVYWRIFTASLTWDTIKISVRFNIKATFSGRGITITKIRRPWDRFVFIMGEKLSSDRGTRRSLYLSSYAVGGEYDNKSSENNSEFSPGGHYQDYYPGVIVTRLKIGHP